MPNTISDQSSDFDSLARSLPPDGITELDDGSERKTPVDFYAYVHMKPDMVPFYVGKGTLKRANTLGKRGRNEWHRRVVEKHGRRNIIIEVIKCKTEAEAFAREQMTIRALRASGVVLCNLTNGGEGASGIPLVGDRRERLMQGHEAWRNDKMKQEEHIRQLRQRTLSEDHKLELSVIATKRMQDPNERKKISEKLTGFKHTEEALFKIRMAAQKQALDPEIQAKKSAKLRGQKRTPEQCLNISLGRKRAKLLRELVSEGGTDVS